MSYQQNAILANQDIVFILLQATPLVQINALKELMIAIKEQRQSVAFASMVTILTQEFVTKQSEKLY